MTQLCTRRETKRHQTALRLQQCAVQLTLDHGFDGWTIEDLAAAADVSRRTVFNYFEGKADVVLGPAIEFDPERVSVFIEGGPTGSLLSDALALASDVIEAHGSGQEMLTAGRNAILGDARLIQLVHERFVEVTEHFTELVRQREGDDFPAVRARLLSRLVLTIFDTAAELAESDPSRPFHEHFEHAVADARLVLS